MNAINLEAFLAELRACDLLLDVRGALPLKATGLQTDSRAVQTGDAFFCITGYTRDGHLFAPMAIELGASLLVVERELPIDVPTIRVSNARRATALAAKLFYGDPSSRFNLIGVTGTNGKTTIIHLADHILREAGFKTGRIGTLGWTLDSGQHPLERTTPDIIELNGILHTMAEAGVEFVVMEVSSHALALDRVFGLRFDLAIFSNLGRDHLDFHRDFEDYKQTKFMLFDYLLEADGTAVINIDDDSGHELFEKLNDNSRSVSFQSGHYFIDKATSSLLGCEFELVCDGIRDHYHLRLIGRHNIMNTALAIAVIREALPQIALGSVQKALAELQNIDGRLEPVPNDRGFGVFVDYAHTPDALESVLSALAEIPHKRLICVCGAGGDRDRGKRPEMTAAMLRHADLAILTTDNPRSEDPRDILRNMIECIDPKANWWVRLDRREAIRAAVRLAREGDIVLVAGKGHEAYQDIQGTRASFDDREELAAALELPVAPLPEALDTASTLPLAEPIDALMLELLFGAEFAGDSDLAFSHLCLDSRTAKPGSLFFALEGDNFDAHDYLPAVLEDTTCAAIVSRGAEHERTLRVDDTLSALGVLAGRYAGLFAAHRVGITGSVGKTTTKEYLHQILSDVAPTLKTLENENNLIGLPKTLFRLRQNHAWAICELGSNHLGEIAALADICRPQTSVVTAIGPVHLEFFGDVDGVWREKNDLLLRTSGARVFPGDEPRFEGSDGVSFGQLAGNDYVIGAPTPENGRLRFSLNDESYEIDGLVPHNALDAAIAAVVALELGIAPEIIRQRLSLPLQLRHRMQIEHHGRRTLIIDCYNAAPDSMQAAIAYWKQCEPDKPHAAILGEMLELGDSAAEHHS
ncbi:MAG: UDP-N-acetylmuramoyl-L-alanyl-D-glutamate--2,6-diaminopimelate ligase, partial [Candidatus Cloacimonetes bacterium]|nr:UDP-N-acetylmuramoyl-L-alanyl-D-glutamate--2,6-diaminopimelate ligase [Candidatus Cloacimonadota bacterium]